ncbi:cytoskeleton-associated protein 2-like isoform X1 [Pogona vitticeps]
MEAGRPGGGAGAGARRGGASAAEEEERRRQLREYLAAKAEGRLGRRQRGGGGGGKPSLKDRTSRQDRALSRPDPGIRGQQNGGPATSRQARTGKDEGGQDPLGRPSQAKAAPSRLPGGCELPGQRPSSGQATRTARREVAPGIVSRAGGRQALTRQAKREGEKENRGGAEGPPPEKKRAAPGGSLRGPCQATAKGQGEKSRQAAGNIPHGIGREAEAQGKPRGLPGSSRREAPRASGARPPLRTKGGPTVSRPATKSRGPDPRAAKPSNPAPLQGERLTGADPLAQRAVRERPPRQQAKGCPAVLTERRAPRPTGALREMPPKGPLAACGSIRPRKSPRRSRVGEERRCRAPGTLGTRAVDHQLAAAARGPTGHGRCSPPPRRPTPQETPGASDPLPSGPEEAAG